MTQKWKDFIEREELQTTEKQTPIQLKDSLIQTVSNVGIKRLCFPMKRDRDIGSDGFNAAFVPKELDFFG